MSQLLLRLERECASEADPVRRGVTFARKACYLARVGRFRESSDVIGNLRAVFGDGRSGLVSAWIMLAEGVLGQFEKLSVGAFDRVVRAQFLAIALKDSELIAVSSAWKAHFEFEISKFDAMARSLWLAIENSTELSCDAQARLSMVLCDAFFVCGNRSEAQKWFMKSRDNSLKDGDQAGIEALMYNRAAFGVSWLRVVRCTQMVSTDVLSAARLELNSARNFQDLTNTEALTHLIDVCNARLLILEEKYESAIKCLETVRYSEPFAANNFDQSLIDLEILYCYVMLGRLGEVPENLMDSLAADFSRLDVDDQLVASWVRRELALRDGRFGSSGDAEARFNDRRSVHAGMVQELSNLLKRFEAI